MTLYQLNTANTVDFYTDRNVAFAEFENLKQNGKYAKLQEHGDMPSFDEVTPREISYVFPGGCWIAAESCGRWVTDSDGRQYYEFAKGYMDTETRDSREYARIFDHGALQPTKWWAYLSEEQRKGITDFAEAHRNKTVEQEIYEINNRSYC